MVTYERSIDIALQTSVPEQSGTLIVVPIKSIESRIASRGLGRHIEKIYDRVFQNANQEKALEVVYDFISTDVEAIRQRSRNLHKSLNPETQSPDSRAFTAAGISYLLHGMRINQSEKKWPQKADEKEQLLNTYREVMGADDLTFHEYAEWAYKQSAKNEIYWKRQLENIRMSFHMNLLRDAIDASDHQVEV